MHFLHARKVNVAAPTGASGLPSGAETLEVSAAMCALRPWVLLHWLQGSHLDAVLLLFGHCQRLRGLPVGVPDQGGSGLQRRWKRTIVASLCLHHRNINAFSCNLKIKSARGEMRFVESCDMFSLRQQKVFERQGPLH